MIRGIMRLVAAFEGGLSYSELRDMPLVELELIHQEAEIIFKARAKAAGG